MLHQSCTDSSNHQNPITQPEPEKPRAEGLEDCSGERTECLTTEESQPEISKVTVSSNAPLAAHEEYSGRERLKRHRVEMAGQVWIPEIWGQESLLKDWVDCSAFDSSLVPRGVASAREALVEECRRANSGGLRIENRC